MSKETEQIEGDLSNRGATLHVLDDFLKHPGWKMYAEMLREQCTTRKGEVLLTPLKKTGDVYAQEFAKGEISGLTLAEVMPFTVLEGLKAEVQTLRQKLENEHEMAERIASGTSGSRVDDERFHS